MKTSHLIATLGLNLAAGMAHAESTQISNLHDRNTVVGSEDLFVGHALIDPLFDSNDTRHTTGGEVTFTPGARSNWHTHPAGQTLVVTDGIGWIQEEGGEKRVIKAGDVIWTPPGIKHWHGASDTHSMTHIAIQEQVDGSAVEWLEPVSDEQYQG
ncbi:(R)-mandelonitrile lyase [Modicisalibacter xianhensis]|uniref:Cupin domain protein n=1 Tax=Modicisalibacter xianhensis TaxID=442341 RepID=A0A1I3D6F6_9GAMM|nr:cupin domain-containing protein [Halomonas xianhensis]SFH82168.1 Cupin domain protein [Halomonas xianhensis]